MSRLNVLFAYSLANVLTVYGIEHKVILRPGTIYKVMLTNHSEYVTLTVLNILTLNPDCENVGCRGAREGEEERRPPNTFFSVKMYRPQRHIMQTLCVAEIKKLTFTGDQVKRLMLQLDTHDIKYKMVSLNSGQAVALEGPDRPSLLKAIEIVDIEARNCPAQDQTWKARYRAFTAAAQHVHYNARVEAVHSDDTYLSAVKAFAELAGLRSLPIGQHHGARDLLGWLDACYMGIVAHTGQSGHVNWLETTYRVGGKSCNDLSLVNIQMMYSNLRAILLTRLMESG
jgi:hypothetical protein